MIIIDQPLIILNIGYICGNCWEHLFEFLQGLQLHVVWMCINLNFSQYDIHLKPLCGTFWVVCCYVRSTTAQTHKQKTNTVLMHNFFRKLSEWRRISTETSWWHPAPRMKVEHLTQKHGFISKRLDFKNYFKIFSTNPIWKKKTPLASPAPSLTAWPFEICLCAINFLMSSIFLLQQSSSNVQLCSSFSLFFSVFVLCCACVFGKQQTLRKRCMFKVETDHFQATKD